MTTINLQLDSDIEKKLRDKAQLRGQSLETYLLQLAVEDVRDANGANAPAATPVSTAESVEAWSREWRAWVASHAPLPIVADDSRESIYAGRGE